MLIGTGIVVNDSVEVDLIAPIDMMLDIIVVGTACNCRPYEGAVKIIEEELVDFTAFELVDAGIIDGIMHSRISADNTYPSLLLGNPDLPRMVESIQLPARGNSELTITEASYTEYLNIELVPSKGKLYRNIDPSTIPYSKSEIYSSNAFYPSQIGNLNTPFCFSFNSRTIH